MKSKIFPFLVLMFSFSMVRAQQKHVSGQVTSDEGGALLGVSVSLKGTSTATTTDTSGHYTISVPSTGKEILIFTYVGKEDEEVSVGSQNVINVSLAKSSSKLNEVVVIGYGTVKRKDLTGAVSSVSGKEIATVPVADVTQAMQGKMAGVNIVSQDGRPGADVMIRMILPKHQNI